MAVVETEEFLSRSGSILNEAERASLVAHLAMNPQAGDVVPGTGGVRKIRWAIRGQRERGSAHVIYYYLSLSVPLCGLDIYAE